MNKLVEHLADVVQSRIVQRREGDTSPAMESRFIFHGPPIELLSKVYKTLIIRRSESDGLLAVPILLQVPSLPIGATNPAIGDSGQCDGSHLLNLRNSPAKSSFVALVPPGQHSIMSVSTTTDEFGVLYANNSANAPFEDWWQDDFVQTVVSAGISASGLSLDQTDQARDLLEHAARAADDVDAERSSRAAAWRVISRLFSSGLLPALSPAQAIALAAGVPWSDRLNAKRQTNILDTLAGAMSGGFGAGIEATKQQSGPELVPMLDAFLAHIRERCDVQTAFERAPAAFYLPTDGLENSAPPDWYVRLNVDAWAELLADDATPLEGVGLEVEDVLVPSGRGLPTIVEGAVSIAIRNTGGEGDQIFSGVLERGGGGGKAKVLATLSESEGLSYTDVGPPHHKSPLRYKITADRYKEASLRVVSLSSWLPGIVVNCRTARKVSLPKRPTGRTARNKLTWESSMSVPGTGRYDLLVYLGPSAEVETNARGIHDDLQHDDKHQELAVRHVRGQLYQIEFEATGNYRVEISYSHLDENGDRVNEMCRVVVTCEDAVEEGVRGEFERLIRLNRGHLEGFDKKAVVQLDRNARSSSLQAWALEESVIDVSYRPIVIADDYLQKWVQPDWGDERRSILSQAQFLHDPRPPFADFTPPPKFVDARRKLASVIRSTDEQSGLIEAAPFGEWMRREPEFGALIEQYVDGYLDWVRADPDVACWVDAIAVVSVEPGGRSLVRVPDAILLSPLHPLRLAWHCVAQQVLWDAVEYDRPCPAASVLDPDCIPDALTLSIRSPDGLEQVDYLSVECNSDYWSVLWNGSRLREMSQRSRQAPFDGSFGVTVGGISSGFSAGQVSRALEDVSNLLSAKSILSVLVSSAGGTTDACNEGLIGWSTDRFRQVSKGVVRNVGPRLVEIYDERRDGSRPDQATIANLSEDTNNHVRWFERQPSRSVPDLGIIAQLETSEPGAVATSLRSPMGVGGLIRHRVRRQLPGANKAFLSESRQGLSGPPSGHVLADKVSVAISTVENGRETKVGLRFAPNVHEIRDMLENKRADFVAISSAAVDPACFLGSWLDGAYLWDYDLPSYSQRAGDTNGYYLLSRVKDADRDGLSKVLARLPNGTGLTPAQVEQVLLEVARRGIPTIRGLSGDDTGATGDLGLLLAARLLQDRFRGELGARSLLPVIESQNGVVTIAIVLPVDPFRGYLADLATSMKRDVRDLTLSRPDLLVVGVAIEGDRVAIHLTPIEVKCRLGSVFSATEAADALSQAKSLSHLLSGLLPHDAQPVMWSLAFQHLVLSMIGFGMRVYSQHEDVAGHSMAWSEYHEQIAAAVLGRSATISVDNGGRLIVIDDSARSAPFDRDGDGFEETIVIGARDAAAIITSDATDFYTSVRSRVEDWQLLPHLEGLSARAGDVDELEAGSWTEQGVTDRDLGQRQGADPTPLPENSDGIEGQSGIVLSVGQTSTGFKSTPLSLNISDTRLNQLNIGVVGDLGTGKTQLLKSLIYQISGSASANRGIKPRFLIFDYKRDYSGDDFVEATGARIVRPTHLPLNLFDTSDLTNSLVPWLDRFRFFADVLDKIYSGIGPVQRDKLKAAVRSAYEAAGNARSPTIYDVHAAYRELLGGKSDSPMAIIDDLVDMEVFAKDPKDTMPFGQFLDGVVVVSLDAMGQDDRSKSMVVATMLNMFYENMLRTPKRPFTTGTPQLRAVDSYLLVDEADNIMQYEFDVLRKLLLQGREFGAGVILASQYLRHFKVNTTDYREPLLTWFVHKVPNVTANELGALGLTADLAELAERVKTLPNHHCLYKSFDVPGEIMRGMPFYELLQAK